MAYNYIVGANGDYDFLLTQAVGGSQTDNIINLGRGNLILTGTGGGAANEKITGTSNDTNTTVWMSDGVPDGTDPLKININLHGNSNTVVGFDWYWDPSCPQINAAPGIIVTPVEFTNSTVTVNVSQDLSYGAPDASCGGNVVEIFNYGGTNTICLAGGGAPVTGPGPLIADSISGGVGNIVYLNADATNVVQTGQNDPFHHVGGAYIHIGESMDNADGRTYTSKVTVAGDCNTVIGAAADFTVSGGCNHNDIELGTGKDSVTTSGDFNYISATDGNDTVALGRGNWNTVILGKGADTVTSAGDHNCISAGNGKDSVSLGGGCFNTVSLGNGTDTVTLSGHDNLITLGNGNDTVTLSGSSPNNNTICAGNGTDTVTLGQGSYDSVTLGNGNDTVTGSGHDNKIFLGNGNDTVTLTGDNNCLTAGNGNDNVAISGKNAVITLGNGNNIVTANGAGDKIYLGTGNNILNALGTGDTIVVGAENFGAPSTNTINIGSGSTLTVNRGFDTITAGANDTIYLNRTLLGTSLTLNGSNDTVYLTEVNGTINLQPSGGNEKVFVDASSGIYTGNLTINGIGNGSPSQPNIVDLHGFGPGLSTYIQFAMNLHAAGNQGWIENLPGGGTIDFAYAQNGMPGPTEIKFA